MSQDLACKFVNVNVNFSEFLLLEVTGVCTDNKSIFIGIIYRSPNSVTDKNSSGDEIANVNFFYNIAHVEASAYAH